jgi:hypothetical protein
MLPRHLRFFSDAGRRLTIRDHGGGRPQSNNYRGADASQYLRRQPFWSRSFSPTSAQVTVMLIDTARGWKC